MKRLISTILVLIMLMCIGVVFAEEEAWTLYWMYPYAEEHAICQTIAKVVAKYQAEVNPNLVYNPEYISDSEPYYQKLKILIGSNEAPDMFWGDADTFTKTLRDQGLLTNIGEIIDELGQRDKFLPITYQYQQYDDGSLYLMATGANNEVFFYHPSLFEKAGIEKQPETWDEFFDVCEKLKAAEITPLSVMGNPWYILRYAAFMPYRMTGNEWISKTISGQTSWGDETGIAMGEFLQKISQYFVDGWAGMDSSACRDYFLAGSAAMWYMPLSAAQSAVTGPDNELIDDIAYFKLPLLDGYTATTEKDYFANSGKGFMINSKTFNAHPEEIKRFIDFFINNFGDIGLYQCNYICGILPNNMDDLSSFVKQMYQDFSEVSPDRYAWCWDVVIDSASNETLKAEIVNLALGEITPQEFGERMDEAIAENVLSE